MENVYSIVSLSGNSNEFPDNSIAEEYKFNNLTHEPAIILIVF
jgi:hypothetical protein